MPLYSFELSGSEGVARHVSMTEAGDAAAAREHALDQIRMMMADAARQGQIDLRGSMLVRDEAGAELFTVRVREAFHVHDGVTLDATDR